MKLLPLLGCFALAQLGEAALKTHDGDFHPDAVLQVTVETVNHACRQRESVVVNGTSPGPPLRIKPDHTTWVRVYNDMETENLTMHWHGLSKSIAPFSDGTPLVSQWPIPPKHFFDYELHPVPEEAGTYFYHSHIGFQAASAFGPLIIEDTTGSPYQYDEERIIQLGEFFNKTDDAIVEGLVASPFVW